MSGGLDRIREKLAAYLNEQGVAAVTAWPAQERLLREGPVTAVTLRACQAAQRELEGRLRPELTPEDCESAFVPAAAWMALAWLNTGTGGEGITSFTAGDVTIRREGGRESAVLLDQAQRLMAPYVRDREFSFLGVRG